MFYKEDEILNFKSDNVVLWSKKCLICFISIVVLGISISFNTMAMLGADPVSVLFHGASVFTGVDMGLITNAINITLIIIVLFLDRKYINIGTLIYAITLGISIEWGIKIYNLMCIPTDFLPRFLISLVGCLLAFSSLGAFIAIDIGVDPWSAIALIISKKTNNPFKIVRMCFDVICMIIGYALGGTVGIITLISVALGGPVIQKMSEILDKLFNTMIKSKKTFKKV